MYHLLVTLNKVNLIINDARFAMHKLVNVLMLAGLVTITKDQVNILNVLLKLLSTINVAFSVPCLLDL